MIRIIKIKNRIKNMTTKKINLEIHRATKEHIAGIIRLNIKIYGYDDAFTEKMLIAHINSFPEGQFVALYNDEIVGHCGTFIISEEFATMPHSWDEITGNGYISRHNPSGDCLYGMEVCVDQSFRGLRIGQRLYEHEKNSAKI